jgi:hypothetical protein
MSSFPCKPRQLDSLPLDTADASSLPGDDRDLGSLFFHSHGEGKKESAPSKRDQTAIHEAAHTTVATMIHPGIVQEVFISDTAVEITEIYDEINISLQGLTGGIRFNNVQTTVFENGLITYSGFFAECENLYRCGVDLAPLLPQLRAQASHDIDRYHALLVSEGLTEGEIQSLVTDIGGALKHYFDSGIWEAVRAIADALLVKGHLTKDEVLELMPEFP